LVTNGTFDTDTSGWTAGWDAFGDELSHDASGKAKIALTSNSTGAYPRYVQAISGLTVGAVYQISWEGDGSGGAAIGLVWTGVSNGTGGATMYAEGNYYYTATATTMYVAMTLFNETTVGDFGLFDNISVKEIDPLSVSIQMNGRMTYADTDSSTEVAFWRWGAVGNWLRWEVQTLGTNIGRLVFQQAKDTVYETLTADAYSPGVFVPFNIAGRHGSTFINGAADGVALTADTTATGLVDLSTTDLILGNIFMGTIKGFQIFDRDLGDSGLVTKTQPSEEPSLYLTFDGTAGSFTVTDWSE
jgi:hypothetical protein